MAQKYNIKQVLSDKSLIGKSLTVQGWIRTRRDSKAGISFIALSDGSCFDPLQLVTPSTLPNYESDVLRLTTGCAIKASGQLIQSEGKDQAVELKVETLEVIGWVSDPESYPMAAKRHTMEHLREYTHLRPRTNIIGAVSRVRNTAAQATHQFFNERGFLWVNTPILTAEDCEGAGELFTVSALDFLQLPKMPQGGVDFSKDFFGRQAYLTVSGQLNAEAYCLALSKVYTFGPTFRAENSNTSRHLAEFWMIEPEVAFADLKDNIALAESLIKYVCQQVLEKNNDDMMFFSKWVDKGCIERINTMLKKEFTVINYSEAIELLKKSNHPFEYEVAWGIDLQSEHERYLCEELFNGPVVVINYPKGIKAFYMRLNDDNKTVAAMDVLIPGVGEIIGGSQREERYDRLVNRLMECGLNPKDYEWYLDLRRYGSVPHAGFGLGFERLIRYITGVNNVRDVIPFARAPQHIPPTPSSV